MLISIDDDNSGFPHDRVVPEEMVNFRPNGKFKNKIADVNDTNLDSSNSKTEATSQLPLDFFFKSSSTSIVPSTTTQTIEHHNYTTSISSFPVYTEDDGQPIILTGIGVAEPVLESELGKNIFLP